MRAIKRSLRSVLRGAGAFVSATTNPQDLRRFFQLIRPVQTQHELIRLGGEGDGGYLVPNDLEGLRTCFSPGVNDVSDFEGALTRRGIKCFLADASVEKPPISDPLFDFEKKFLGSRSEGVYMTLEDWVARKSPGEDDLILQMDIEGAEYDVILSSSDDLLRRFRILIVEFHHLDHLYDAFAFRFLRLAFEKLRNDFEVVHIHPNNSQHPVRMAGFTVPPVIEATFLRRDRITMTSPRSDFPHPLDRANVRKRGDLVLPEVWYR